MNDYPTFPNPPITEALIDIRAKLNEKTDLAALESVQEPIKERYKEKKSQHFVSGQFDLSKGPDSCIIPGEHRTNGLIFRCESENKIVQAKFDGFTFNKLRPYENWDVFRSEGFDLWKLYCDRARPEKVLRLALRYINRIEIPLPINDFNEYLLTNPQIAPGLPQDVAHFLMRLVFQKESIGATANIIQKVDRQTSPDKLPIIIDIDVFKMVEYDPGSTQIWNDLEELRSFKNDIFFESLTDKAKELFYE